MCPARITLQRVEYDEKQIFLTNILEKNLEHYMTLLFGLGEWDISLRMAI